MRAFVAAATNFDSCPLGRQRRLWSESAGENLASDLPAEVEVAFLRASTMREAATELNSNLGAVRQWLSDFPDFAQQWLAHVREQRFSKAKAHVEKLIAAKPTITRAELIKECHTDVEWLARQAPASLRSLLNRLPAKRGPQGELF